MQLKNVVFILILMMLFGSACSGDTPDTAEPDAAAPTVETAETDPASAPTTAVESTPEPTETDVPIPAGVLPTAETPTGTVLETVGNDMLLAHPHFSWLVTLPADWIITYDSGFQLEANSPDQAVFARIQAQRWETAEGRLPNARAYVDHWKNFTYGDVFPLYADGEQLAEIEVAPNKFGGSYLQYEFLDSVDGLHYFQIYASAGGPGSAMLSVWTAADDYAAFQAIMEAILASFELVESGE